MKVNVHFGSYLGHSFLEREMFETKFLENIETRI